VTGGILGCSGEPRRPVPERYVVRPGDTLYSISWRHRLDYHDVARWNGIGPDFRIEVGQLLVLSPAVTSRAGPAAPPEVRSAREPAAQLPVSAPPEFQWPADGTFAGTMRQPAGGLGLRIAAAFGDAVRAAAAGRVVYTGAGLRSYGQLVIIQHDDAWLTAYGYNQSLNVSERETVRAGQRIATVGRGPGNQPMVYFEIRMNGRPVDPLTLLPRR
jgi:lipoprotein NlpD